MIITGKLEVIANAANTIHRAQGPTGQLLTFAKGGTPIQKIGSLFPFIEETARFVLSGTNIKGKSVSPYG